MKWVKCRSWQTPLQLQKADDLGTAFRAKTEIPFHVNPVLEGLRVGSRDLLQKIVNPFPDLLGFLFTHNQLIAPGYYLDSHIVKIFSPRKKSGTHLTLVR